MLAGGALGKISNASYNITVSDSSANVVANIAALNANTHVSSVALSGTGTQTLALTAAQLAANTTILGKISNTTYSITVSDTAAHVAAHIAANNHPDRNRDPDARADGGAGRNRRRGARQDQQCGLQHHGLRYRGERRGQHRRIECQQPPDGDYLDRAGPQTLMPPTRPI
jgi:hypothetical protein